MSPYSPPLAALWAMERLPELGPGSPNDSARDALAALSIETAFPKVRDREAATACLSGLWLYHDFLDESHKISQDLPGWFGSYWHGIMHRREPDPDNSKYWFRRVPTNPVFEAMVPACAELGFELPSKKWDPFKFVDLCEQHRGCGSARELLLRQVQLMEMKLLFEHCYRLAVE